MMSFIIFNSKKLLKKNKYIYFIVLKTIYFLRIIFGLNSQKIIDTQNK